MAVSLSGAPVSVASPEQIGARVFRVTAAELGATWREGCPVAPKNLRRVQLLHTGFDGEPHRGELVMHESVVREVISIFQSLYDLRFPIEKMRTVDLYPDASDELSMRDNNTSGFNCRRLPNSPRWSQHAFGRAVDVNPRLNPYVDRRGTVAPANATPYVDRARIDPGLLHDGDPAVRAFTDRGWQWGGHWRSPLDYQHFERP